MEDKRSKINHVFYCKICVNKYNLADNKPRIMPCGKTLCDKCIRTSASNNENSEFWCPFCSEYHLYDLNKKSGNGRIPLNDTIVYLLKTNRAMESDASDSSSSNNKIKQGSTVSATVDSSVRFKDLEDTKRELSARLVKNPKLKKLNAKLDELKLNSSDLGRCLKISNQYVESYFDQMEKEIHHRADQLVDEIKEARNCLVKELNSHRAAAIDHLNESLTSKSSTHLNLNANFFELVDAIAKTESFDEQQVKGFHSQLDELNERFDKIKHELESLLTTQIKFDRSDEKFNIGLLIGKFDINTGRSSMDDEKTFLSSSSSVSHRPKKVVYKIPTNTKNLLVGFVGNKQFLKVTEFSGLVDEFNYQIAVQLLDTNGSSVKKSTTDTESYRIKRLQTNCVNNCSALQLVNKFSTTDNLLLLFDGDLDVVKRLHISGNIVDLYMDASFVYVLMSVNGLQVNKLNYELKLVKSYSCGIGNRHVQLSKSSKILTIRNEKLFTLDVDKNRLKIYAESTGDCVRSFAIDLDPEQDSEQLLLSIDPAERLAMFDRKNFKLKLVDSSTGSLVEHKKLASLVESVDLFCAFTDSTYALIDKKNCLIIYF